MIAPPVALPSGFLRQPIAHRGYHDRKARRIENSPAAFAAAIAAGYAIELDVQRTADDRAVVFHDDRLDRLTTRAGPVAAHPAAVLAGVALRDSDDTIPTLEQVLDLVAGQVPLLIEIKERLAKMDQTDGRLEAAVAQALRGYAGPVAVMSFNPHCMAHMARLAPAIPRGLTTEAYNPIKNLPIPAATCRRLRAIPDYDATGASFISHQAADLARPRVGDLKAQGAAILCWTIRSPAEEAKARRIAHNITFEAYAAALPT